MELDGYAVAHGMPYLQELPLDRGLNFIWHMLTKNREQRDIEKLRIRLWQPPLGEAVTDPRSPWSPQNEGNALSAFARQVAA